MTNLGGFMPKWPAFLWVNAPGMPGSLALMRSGISALPTASFTPHRLHFFFCGASFRHAFFSPKVAQNSGNRFLPQF
jgi:hypothetical protein